MNTSSKLKASLVIVPLVLALAFVSYAAFFKGDSSAQAQDNPIPKITKPDTSSTLSTTPLSLPQPQDSPKDEYEKVPITQIGSIEIPRISMKQNLYEGIWLTVLNVGPGHWPGTAQPGGYGNTVIAGHRVTHSRPFRNIDQLTNGDEIIVTTDSGRFVYKVTGSEVVTPKDVWIVNQTPGYKITLFACHPPGSARYRYVVHGELVNPPSNNG